MWCVWRRQNAGVRIGSEPAKVISRMCVCACVLCGVTPEVTSRFITSRYRLKRLMTFCENSLSLRDIPVTLRLLLGSHLHKFDDHGKVLCTALCAGKLPSGLQV